MSPDPKLSPCEWAEQAYAHALQALPANELPAVQAHLASCSHCQRELESLRPVVDRFVSWPTDLLRPTASLQGRLALRIAEDTGKQPVPPPARQWSEPDWEQVAPGIECKLLAFDAERHRVSMLVRLALGASYPAHTHAGVEELHLLDGELLIDERKLLPGDYSYSPPGARDERVWRARLERDRLYLRACHQYQRYPSLKRGQLKFPGGVDVIQAHEDLWPNPPGLALQAHPSPRRMGLLFENPTSQPP